MQQFNVVKVFSATLARNREDLGATVTKWLREHPKCEIVDMRVAQSSDREFHCISIIMFFFESGH